MSWQIVKWSVFIGGRACWAGRPYFCGCRHHGRARGYWWGKGAFSDPRDSSVLPQRFADVDWTNDINRYAILRKVWLLRVHRPSLRIDTCCISLGVARALTYKQPADNMGWEHAQALVLLILGFDLVEGLQSMHKCPSNIRSDFWSIPYRKARAYIGYLFFGLQGRSYLL